MSWDLVIFDCDGVLVDSEPIANRVMCEMVGEVGLPMSYDETVRTFIGRSMSSCVALIEERLGRRLTPGFAAEFHVRTVERFRSELQPVPGIEDALDRIALPTCVASSGEIAKMEVTLGVTGLLPRFRGRIFSATQVPRGKPAPDLFLHAARQVGARPERCVVVEDTVLGVQAAVAAGMHVFGFAGRSDPEELARAGAQVFHDMRLLPGLLQAGPSEAHRIVAWARRRNSETDPHAP
jgi:HAD superfamily hydrolase (TIGR01509 family)